MADKQIDMYDPGTPDGFPPDEPVDLMSRIGERVTGKKGWRWCRSRVAGDPQTSTTYIIHGSTPIGTYTRGKRKGQPKWPKSADLDEVVVTRAEMDAERDIVEAETGKCYPCAGSGRVCYRAEAGPPVQRHYRGCSRCNASGKPPSALHATLPS